MLYSLSGHICLNQIVCPTHTYTHTLRHIPTHTHQTNPEVSQIYLQIEAAADKPPLTTVRPAATHCSGCHALPLTEKRLTSNC